METLNHYIIKEEIVVEQTIDKSKFITYFAPVQSEAEAKEYLREIKKMHPKATHHCSAYRVGEIERSNDDGEPASSAGHPMLQVLRGNHIENAIAVVVRYFGGILLGVGGLIRAYGSSVTLAIREAKLFAPKEVYEYEVSFPYSAINDVEMLVSNAGEVTNRDYKENVQYTITVTNPDSLDNFSDITRGLGKLVFIRKYLEYVEDDNERTTLSTTT